MDWLNEAGHRIRRIDGYAEWFTRFDSALRGRPELQKQHSLLHAFARPAEPVDGAGDIPTERFRTAVQTAKVGAEKDIPHVSAELIRKYAADLKGLDLLL